VKIYERLKAALIERLDGPHAGATLWKIGFTALACAEVVSIPLVFRQFGDGPLPSAAVLLLLFEEWLALRWRDACVRAEALEQFLTVVGAARLAEGAEP